MDYEKKYKEALERAKNYHDNNFSFGTTKLTEAIFPELRESEDERIRKYLIDELKAAKSVGELKFIIPQPTREECITYLEKQKEKSLPATEVLARAGLKPYKDGNQWCILAGDNIQEGICGFGDTIDEALYQFLMEVLEKQKELNHDGKKWIYQNDYYKVLKSWYMEGYQDREHNQEPKWIIRTGEGGPRYEENPKYGQPLTETQKPAEWSEEDERILYNVIAYVGYAAGEKGVKDDDFKEANEWLINFRFRSSWKPSKEQLEALEKAIVRSCSYQYGTPLSELYEQLKKL